MRIACFSSILLLVLLPCSGLMAQPQQSPPANPSDSGSARPSMAVQAGVTAPVGENFEEYPELALDKAIGLAVEYSPQLKAQGEVVEQVKTNSTRAWALLLPTLDVSGSYTLTDQEISLNMGDYSDLFRLVALNCTMWDETTMGTIPTICQQPAEPSTGSESASSSSSERVIQQRHNFDASVTVGVSLLNLRTWPNLANVSTYIELAELQKEFSEEQLVYAVVQMYYAVATAQESVKLMRENLVSTMRHMDMTEARFKNGTALQNERVRAAMAVVQARSNLDQATVALGLAREALALTMGLQDSHFRVAESFTTPWDSLASGIDADMNLDDRRDLQILQKSEVIAERNIDDAWVRFAPTIMGIWKWSISSNKGFGESYDSWRAMITLSWSVFDGGYRFADLDERRAKLREIRYTREQASLAARQEIAKARAELKAADVALRGGNEMLALARENLELVEKQYRLGVAPQTTVTDAELMYSQARIQVITAQLRQAMARVALVKASGQFYRK